MILDGKWFDERNLIVLTEPLCFPEEAILQAAE